MPRRWIAGGIALGTGLLWLLIDRILDSEFPLSWGGPNIGRGALNLLAGASIAIGVALLLLARPGRRGTTLSPRLSRGVRAADLRIRGRLQAVTLLIDGTLLLAVIITYLLAPGDGNEINAGVVGLTVSADGRPLLVLQVCHGSVDRIRVYGPNRKSAPNETILDLRSSVPVTRAASIDPSTPPSGWAGEPASLRSSAQRRQLLIASARGTRNELRQLSFTSADLAALSAGTVLYSVGDTTQQATTASFADRACN